MNLFLYNRLIYKLFYMFWFGIGFIFASNDCIQQCSLNKPLTITHVIENITNMEEQFHGVHAVVTNISDIEKTIILNPFPVCEQTIENIEKYCLPSGSLKFIFSLIHLNETTQKVFLSLFACLFNFNFIFASNEPWLQPLCSNESLTIRHIIENILDIEEQFKGVQFCFPFFENISNENIIRAIDFHSFPVCHQTMSRLKFYLPKHLHSFLKEGTIIQIAHITRWHLNALGGRVIPILRVLDPEPLSTLSVTQTNTVQVFCDTSKEDILLRLIKLPMNESLQLLFFVYLMDKKVYWIDAPYSLPDYHEIYPIKPNIEKGVLNDELFYEGEKSNDEHYLKKVSKRDEILEKLSIKEIVFLSTSCKKDKLLAEKIYYFYKNSVKRFLECMFYLEYLSVDYACSLSFFIDFVSKEQKDLDLNLLTVKQTKKILSYFSCGLLYIKERPKDSNNFRTIYADYLKEKMELKIKDFDSKEKSSEYSAYIKTPRMRTLMKSPCQFQKENYYQETEKIFPEIDQALFKYIAFVNRKNYRSKFFLSPLYTLCEKDFRKLIALKHKQKVCKIGDIKTCRKRILRFVDRLASKRFYDPAIFNLLKILCFDCEKNLVMKMNGKLYTKKQAEMHKVLRLALAFVMWVPCFCYEIFIMIVRFLKGG